MTLALLAHGAVIAALQTPNSAIVGAGGIVLDAVGIDIVDSSVLESRAMTPTPGGDVAPEQMLTEEGNPTPPSAESPPSEAKPRPPDETEDKKERREPEKVEVKPPPSNAEKPPEDLRETPPPPSPQLAEPLPEPAPEGPPPPAKEPEPKPTPPEKPVIAEAPRPPEQKEVEPPKPREEHPNKEPEKKELAPKPKPAAPPQMAESTGGAVVRQSNLSQESGGREAASPGEKARYQAMLVKLIAKARPDMRTIRTKARGTTRLTFQLGPDGSLIRVTVKISSGNDTLDEAAMAAIRSVTFPPAPAGMSDKDRFFEVPFVFR